MTPANAPGPDMAQHGAPSSLRDCLAPAKLNLFLHITGRRDDGYHRLQTVFQLLDWGDRLHFTRRADGSITRRAPLAGVALEQDLAVRAARLLRAHCHCKLGVDIEIEKRLPMGAGLGGGSSDAATTLLALNRLWDLRLSREALQALALRLGADVPFFVFGRNAFAEGVGEALTPIKLPERHFLVVTPAVHVSTAEIFRANELTRDTDPVTIANFLGQQCFRRDMRAGVRGGAEVGSALFGRNDMQTVVMRRYAEVARVWRWLSSFAPARMTGSGASVFAVFDDIENARAAQAQMPAEWSSSVASSLQRHPLFAFANRVAA